MTYLIDESNNHSNDSKLVNDFKYGDQSAYEELINRYTDKVFRLAMRITRHQEDAEEVVQEVCLSVFRKIDEFEGKSAFSSWLYRITSNAALMKLRKRKKHATIELDEVVINSQDTWTIQRSDSSDVEYISIKHELKQALIDAIHSLPLDYRKIFILRDIDGFSNQDVGDSLNLSLAAVKSRLHRSRMLLRKKLVEFYDGSIVGLGIEDESEDQDSLSDAA